MLLSAPSSCLPPRLNTIAYDRRRGWMMLAAITALALAFRPQAAHAQTQVFSDGSFGVGWTATWIPHPLGTAPDTFTGPPITPGPLGPSDLYRETTHHMKATQGHVVLTAHTFASATWNPATASIDSLAFEYDLRHLISKDHTSTTAAAGFAVLILQGGVYYRSPWSNVFADTWQNFKSPALGLKAADFIRVDGAPGNPNPDFSCKGGSITFGYVMGNSNPTGGSAYDIIAGIDNWKVTLTTRPCASCLSFTGTKVSCATGPSGPSGCYTVTTTVTNNTGQPITALLLASSQATPNSIPLSPALPSGQSRTVTFTYCPPASATTASIVVSPHAQSGAVCCQTSLPFDLPKCPVPECLWVPRFTARCVTGAPLGTFDLSLDYRNMSNCSTRVFLVAAPPSSTSPSYFPGAYPPNPLGPSYSLGTIRVTGANSSTYCFTVAQYCGAGEPCCSRRVCVPVPNCWPSPLPSPTPDITPLGDGTR